MYLYNTEAEGGGSDVYLFTLSRFLIERTCTENW